MAEVPEDTTDNAAGISKLSNIALNMVVFSILSFLIAWLFMAVLQRGPYALTSHPLHAPTQCSGAARPAPEHLCIPVS